jgi:hypothetical protein
MNMTRLTIALSAVTLLLAACGPVDPDGVGGGAGGSAGAAGGSAGGAGGSSASLNKADCAAFAANAVTAQASCGAPAPSNGAATLQTACERGVDGAAACGGNPAGGLACFRTPDATDYVCQLGNIFPACNGDLAAALGMYCLVSLGNPSCASGIHCEFDTDCSGSTACNSKTGQCLSKAASCIGLPCTWDTDCPSAEKCNSAEGACVGR